MLPERIHSPARPETKKRQNRFSEARSKWGPRKAALQALWGKEPQQNERAVTWLNMTKSLFGILCNSRPQGGPNREPSAAGRGWKGGAAE